MGREESHSYRKSHPARLRAWLIVGDLVSGLVSLSTRTSTFMDPIVACEGYNGGLFVCLSVCLLVYLFG